MKRVITIVLAVIVTLMAIQVYNLNNKKTALKTNLEKVTSQTDNLEKENKKLQADLDYFADPLNLIKELKSKFNYKKPGEKLIIVVPKE